MGVLSSPAHRGSLPAPGAGRPRVLPGARSPRQPRSRARPVPHPRWAPLCAARPVAAALAVVAFWMAVSTVLLWSGKFHGILSGAGAAARSRNEGSVSEGPAGEGTAGEGSAAGGWWVRRLEESGRWEVANAYKGVAAASLVSHRDSFACLLVLRDVCHVWHPDRHVSGYWYAKGGADLAALVSGEDACGHRARPIPPPFSAKRVQTVSDIQEKMGVFLSPSQLAALLASPYPRFQDETTMSPQDILPRATGFTGSPDTTAGEGVPPAARTGAAADARGRAGPPVYEESAGVLRRSHRARAILSPHDSFLGHFVERVGGLAEISAALAASLGDAPAAATALPLSQAKSLIRRTALAAATSIGATRTLTGLGKDFLGKGSDSGSRRNRDMGRDGDRVVLGRGAADLEGGLPVPEAVGPLLENAGLQLAGGGAHGLASVMLFGTDSRVSSFAGNVSRLLFGPDLVVMPGRWRPQLSHECFQEALFPLNAIYSRRGVRSFKRRVSEWLARSSRQPEAPAGSMQQTGPRPPAQVTWLWRQNRRTIANEGEVLKALLGTCGLPVHVVEFSETSSFLDVVATMQRTRLLVGMHGSAFANMIFMPDDAAVLELVPFLYRYHPFMVLAKAYGLQGWQWTNTERRSAGFDNDCFKDKLWGSATTKECWVNKSCLRCVRDHAITTIDVRTLRRLLVDMRRTWASD